jgi:hypothetical protein
MCSKILKLAGCVLLAAAWACDGLKIVPGSEGNLIVNVSMETPFGVKTKSEDLSAYNFLLMDSRADTVYYNTVGEIAGSTISLEPDFYHVIVFNRHFSVPAFDQPYYYGYKMVEVVAGQTCEVQVVCKQENCGVRIIFSEAFTQFCTTYEMLVSGACGSLDYDNTTTGMWGFFNPGQTTLQLWIDQTLFGSAEKYLDSGHMYSFLVEETGNSQENVEPVFTISVDTTRTWTADVWNELDITTNKGTEKETAYTVAEARTLEGGMTDVWVTGYIVGYYVSSTSFEAGGTNSNTNLALADDSGETVKSNTLSVKIPDTAIRDELNLSTNPENLYQKVWLKGRTVESYFGEPGLELIQEVVW